MKSYHEKPDTTGVVVGIGGQIAGTLIASTSDSDRAKHIGKAMELISNLFLLAFASRAMRSQAEELAALMEQAHIPIPKTKRAAPCIVLAALLIVLLGFMPDLMDSCQTLRQNKQTATANWHYLYDHFQALGFHVSGDDPETASDVPDYSFYVTPDEKNSSTYASITLSKSGSIESVAYHDSLSVHEAPSVTVQKAHNTLAGILQELHQAVRLGAISVGDPRLCTIDDPLFDEFVQQLEAGSYFTPIHLSHDDGVSPYFTSLILDTLPEYGTDGHDRIAITYYAIWSEL